MVGPGTRFTRLAGSTCVGHQRQSLPMVVYVTQGPSGGKGRTCVAFSRSSGLFRGVIVPAELFFPPELGLGWPGQGRAPEVVTPWCLSGMAA